MKEKQPTLFAPIVRGYCDYDNRKCECWPGYRGEDCSIETECMNNCTSPLHGKCLKNGRCICESLWMGSDCSYRRCPHNCNEAGTCLNTGTCDCYKGFYGIDCGMSCANNCTHNGYCM